MFKPVDMPVDETTVRTLPIAFEEKGERFTTRNTIGRIEQKEGSTSTLLDGKAVELPHPPFVILLPVARKDWEATKAAVDAAWAHWDASRP